MYLFCKSKPSGSPCFNEEGDREWQRQPWVGTCGVPTEKIRFHAISMHDDARVSTSMRLSLFMKSAVRVLDLWRPTWLFMIY